jgi:hypothetical protein
MNSINISNFDAKVLPIQVIAKLFLLKFVILS